MGDIFRIGLEYPERVFAEYERNGASVSLTYGGFGALCERAASCLHSAAGEGRFIGLFGENSPEWLVLFWAILKSGNKPYLINTSLPGDAVRRAMGALCASALVYTGSAPGIAETELSYDALIDGPCAPEKAAPAFGDELAVTTGGTDLREKICVFTGREISEQIFNCEQIYRANRRIFRRGPGGVRMLMLLPLYHVFGLEASYLWFALFGVTYVFPGCREPGAILKTIREKRVTHVFAVPLFWRAAEKTVQRELRTLPEKERERAEKALERSIGLQSFCGPLGRAYAKAALSEERCWLFGPSVRFCISGGSALADTALRLVNALGYPLCVGYGMSEIGVGSVELSPKLSDRLKNSVGKPLGSVRFTLDGEGRLGVSGSSVCARRFIDGAEADMPEVFPTGDIMTADSGGRYYYCGRESELVFGEAGEKLNPELAETAFDLPGAAAFSVLGDANSEGLMLVVQIPEGMDRMRQKALYGACEEANAKLTPAYRVRKIFFTHDAILPEGGIKVSRARLKRAIEDGSVRLFEPANALTEACPEPDEELKRIIRGMIAQVLLIDETKVEDGAHFFYDLGGSSLDYLTLIGMIDSRFGITLGFEAEGFDYSLSDIARKVEEELCS